METGFGTSNGRITWFVALSSMVAATGGIMFGYDIGMSGGVTSMEPFLKKFFPEVYNQMKDDSNISNYCKFESQLLTFFTSSFYLAGLIASLIASSITRIFGRKTSILIGGTANLTGAVFGSSAYNVRMLILGRVLLGFGVGFATQSVPLYLSEMAPPRFRGAFGFGFQFCFGIGVLSANLINYGTVKIKAEWGWRISLALAAVPATVLTLGALFLPETPNSLIEHPNGHEKAERMLRKIRGTTEVEAELNDLIKASEISKTVKNSFRILLLKKYRPQLVMAITILFFQQVTGINVITFYVPILFRTLGSGDSQGLLSAVIIGLVSTNLNFLSLLIVDKLGRKSLFNIGGIQMFVTVMMIGAIMGAKLEDEGGLSKSYSFFILILICMYIAGFALSWGPLGWLVTSEIFALEIRSAAQSIAVAMGFLTVFVIGQTFLVTLCHFKSGIFFFSGGWVAIMTGFVNIFLPETKNIPIEKMEIIWRQHWFWKKFVQM